MKNIAFPLLFACVAALVLRLAGMRFGDSFLFAGIGFGAHMFEDALITGDICGGDHWKTIETKI